MTSIFLPFSTLQAAFSKVKKASFNQLTSSFLKSFDLIIGAEICYSEEVSQDIIKLIKRAFESNVNRIIIGDPGRPDFYDCHAYCTKQFKSELLQLPGSINGKATHVLSAYGPL